MRKDYYKTKLNNIAENKLMYKVKQTRERSLKDTEGTFDYWGEQIAILDEEEEKLLKELGEANNPTRTKLMVEDVVKIISTKDAYKKWFNVEVVVMDTMDYTIQWLDGEEVTKQAVKLITVDGDEIPYTFSEDEVERVTRTFYTHMGNRETDLECLLQETQVNIQQSGDHNLVVCGNCGEIQFHSREHDSFICYNCKEVMDVSDCSDVFY